MSIPSAADSCRGTDLELEAMLRLRAARDLVEYVLQGHVVPQPWLEGARGLIALAETMLEAAA